MSSRFSVLSCLKLLLLFRRRFFGRRLLGSLLLRWTLRRLGRGFRFGMFRRRFLYLGLLLRKFRSCELLPVESNLGDPHCGVSLAMPAQLFVLLLALVMENQNLGAAALLDHFAD